MTVSYSGQKKGEKRNVKFGRSGTLTVTKCVFPRRALHTPSAAEAIPTLTSTSTIFGGIVPLSDGFFFFRLFGGLNPSWRSSSHLT